MMRMISIVFAILVGSHFVSQASAEQGNQNAILVLDASGSMWGQIDGTPKIQIAREVIGVILDDWNDATQLGLVAYGHREKGSCDDIEVLIPVGPVNADNTMRIVNSINPKGKTPIAASVKAAADALKYTENSARIVLVSDGLETCNQDPCALATSLETSGVDMDVHVVGFDVSADETAQLKCIADNTGGKFLRASSAAELTSALNSTIEKLASTNKDLVFAETFDDDAERGTEFNFDTFDQFSVVKGSVDIIGNGSYGIFCIDDRGGCVDLDGTNEGEVPTVLFTSRKIEFKNGVNYSLEFGLSGNQRGYPPDSVQILVGENQVKSVGPIKSDDPFKIYQMEFTVERDISQSVSFLIPEAADLAGPILDDVFIKIFDADGR